MADSEVSAKGLKEFNRSVKSIRSILPKTAQAVSLNAARIVVMEAVPTIPRRSGAARKSVQGLATNEGASVTGGNGIPYFRWLAIGGASGRRHANKRKIVRPDRYLNPAYERSKERIQKETKAMVDKALRDAGIEVKT